MNLNRVHVIGSNGYIGKALVKAGAIPLECDVTDYDSIDKALVKEKPNLVIDLAGKTDVSYCENPKNSKESFKVNVRGVSNVALALSTRMISGVYISSYHIWRGGRFEEHKERSKLTEPVNVYGMQKVAAETVALGDGMKVIRTSYIFDSFRLAGKLSLLKQEYDFQEPTFLKRSFIHLNHFVSLVNLYCLGYNEMPDILHLAGRDTVSWYDFMVDVAKGLGFDRKLVKKKYMNDSRITPRPYNGGLDTSLARKIGFPSYSYFQGIEEMRNGDS